MLRSELPARLAERFPQLQLKDTELAVDVILLAIRDALADALWVKMVVASIESEPRGR